MRRERGFRFYVQTRRRGRWVLTMPQGTDNRRQARYYADRARDLWGSGRVVDNRNRVVYQAAH